MKMYDSCLYFYAWYPHHARRGGENEGMVDHQKKYSHGHTKSLWFNIFVEGIETLLLNSRLYKEQRGSKDLNSKQNTRWNWHLFAAGEKGKVGG